MRCFYMKKSMLVLFLVSLFLCSAAYAALQVSFNPNPVSPGEELNINVQGGQFYRYLYLYDNSSKYLGSISGCTSSYCDPHIIKFPISSNFTQGTYKIGIMDKSTNIYAYF